MSDGRPFMALRCEPAWRREAARPCLFGSGEWVREQKEGCLSSACSLLPQQKPDLSEEPGFYQVKRTVPSAAHRRRARNTWYWLLCCQTVLPLRSNSLACWPL